MAEDRSKNSKSGEKTLIRDISFCGVAENGANASMVDVKDGGIIRIIYILLIKQVFWALYRFSLKNSKFFKNR